MQPPFPLRLPFEMLHRVGDINLGAIDASLQQRLIENPAGRPDERLSLVVLAIAWLLAHHDDTRLRATLAENGLGCVFPEIAGTAMGGFMGQGRQVALLDARVSLLAGSSGRLRVNSLPSPGRETATISPPCRRASSRAR